MFYSGLYAGMCFMFVARSIGSAFTEGDTLVHLICAALWLIPAILNCRRAYRVSEKHDNKISTLVDEVAITTDIPDSTKDDLISKLNDLMFIF